MSANKPKRKEIDQRHNREEQEKAGRKGGQNPNQRGEEQRGEDAEDIIDGPNYRDQGGKQKNR
jgi:hypothetical protein